MAVSVGLFGNLTQAAPAEAQVNANLFPKDTAVLANIRIASLDQTLKDIASLSEKITGEPMKPIFEDFDKHLTDVLGREASFEKDIKPLLGDYLTIGARFTDDQLAIAQKALDSGDTSGVSSEKLQLTPLIVLSVKNDAGVTKFLTEVVEKAKEKGSEKNSVTSRKEGAFTIWEQSGTCETNCTVLVQGRGYIVAGMTAAVKDWLAWKQANTAGLNTDTNFTKITNALKPNSMATIYLGQRLFYYMLVSGRNSMMGMNPMAGMDAPDAVASSVDATAAPTDESAPAAAATPDAEAAAKAEAKTQQAKLTLNLVRSMNGQAIGIRPSANKTLTLDVVQSFDQAQLATLMDQYGLPVDVVTRLMTGKISYKLASRVSDKALIVLTGQGLTDLYQVGRAALKKVREMNPDLEKNDKQFRDLVQAPAMIEGALKIFFDMTIEQDIAPFANGEFALYAVYDKDSDLSKLNQQGMNDAPFDPILVLDVADAAKATTFLTKINRNINSAQGAGPTKVEGQDNLYTIKLPNGLTLAYGLVGKSFVITTNSGLKTALAALNGDGVLANTATWKAAQKTALNPSASLWFINLSQITPLIKEQAGTGKDSEQMMKVLDLLDSATISTGSLGADGLNRMTINLVAK